MALKLFSANSVGCCSPTPRENKKEKRIYTQSGRFSATEINVRKEHSWRLSTV